MDSSCVFLKNQRNDNISISISFLRFPLTMMVVMYHCYCVQVPQNQPLYAALVYPFGLMLGETGVPAFFFISGFLFFYSQRKYSQKMRTRVSTLVVPYLFWNALILFVYLGLMLVGHPLEIADKNILDFQALDYIRAFLDRGKWDNGNGQPLLCPYWYVRNLIVLSIIAPLIRYFINGGKAYFVFPILLFWWMILPYNGMLAQSLLFFCMGAFFSVNEVNPLNYCEGIHGKILVTLWIILVLLDWLVHFCFPIWGSLYIHRFVLIMNIFVFLKAGCVFSRKLRPKPILEKSSFWIYTTHYPLTLLIRETHIYLNDWLQICYYWMSFFVILWLCITTYWIGQRFVPGLLGLVTGNR